MEVLLWFGYVYAYKVRQRELGKRVGLVSSAETEVGLVSSAETEVLWWFGYVVAFGLDRVNRGDGN